MLLADPFPYALPAAARGAGAAVRAGRGPLSRRRRFVLWWEMLPADCKRICKRTAHKGAVRDGNLGPPWPVIVYGMAGGGNGRREGAQTSSAVEDGAYGPRRLLVLA